MKTTGYSLWIEPEGKLFGELSKIISFYSRLYGFPNFDPHVTLLGGISEIRNLVKVKNLFKNIPSIKISFKSAKKGDFYFKSVYFEIVNSKSLVDANFKVSNFFGMNSEFKPHLSLVYGTPEEKIKDQIVRDVNKLHFPNFEVSKICLYETNGFISDWRKLKEFKLKV